MAIEAIEATEDWTFAHLRRVETLWGPHGYHRYPAKFIPQLVGRLIEMYSTSGALVGDPFLGSATTGLEALRLGRRFWGGDISQVALLISRAKCTLIDQALVSDAWQQLDNCLNTMPHPGKRFLTQDEKDAITAIDIVHATGEKRLRYWFPTAYRASLEAILQHVLLISEETLRTFFLCGFSNILKRCSIWLSGSTKPQKDLSKMLGDPVEEFRRQIRDMLQRNRLYWHDVCGRGLNPSELGQRWNIDWQDARHLALPDATFDLVVTSPPYAICYEYKEIHQLTQLWLEHIGILVTTHQQDIWIGSKGVAHRNVPGTPFSSSTGSSMADAALNALSLLAVGISAQGVNRDLRALRYYFQDMYAAIGELSRVTVPGKRCVLIVGNSYRRGITIPTSAALCEMACAMGFELERKIVRQIPVRVLVSTRDKTTGRFSSTGQSDTQVYPEEHILIFRRCS